MKRKLIIALTAAMLVFTAAGCGKSSGNDTAKTTTEAADSSESADADEGIAPFSSLPQLEGVQEGDTIATLHTNKGDIKVWFFPDYAPLAVENFVTHAQEGYYDGLTFHRVINEFMIQGGDPNGTGTGGESIWGTEFVNEVSLDLRSFRGALCMANAGPDTNGSQFYIVQNTQGQYMKEMLESSVAESGTEIYGSYMGTDGNELTVEEVFPQEVIDAYETMGGGYPTLDLGYTIFGQVYEGMDIVDDIAAVETDASDKPLEDVIIESIEVGTY